MRAGSQAMSKVGIIGLGAMGSAICHRFSDIGVPTVGYEISREPLRWAAELALELCESPRAVAESCEIVSVLVRTDEETRDCVLGDGGAMAGMGSGKMLLLQSTIHPDTTREIAQAGQSRGVVVADAPIAGIPSALRAGRGVVLVGAEREHYPRIEQHLRLVFRDVLHMGPPGSGNVAKIVKNLTTAAEALIMAEAVRIGEAAGIDYLATLEMLTRVEQFHFVDHWKMAFDPTGSSSEPLRVPNLYDKDVPLAGQLTDDLDVDAPVTRALVAAARRICERSRGALTGAS